MTEPLVIATAGHVDHGKTALVLALTGRDTDRLPAEKSRGISIELGFAPLELPSGRRISLVDVPGHERFVRHMVAGASGVDGYLLCIAADDGAMPQTREHLAVLRLLGVADGVVALTKADLADPARASREARELVGGRPAIVPVSSPSGHGVEAVRTALDALAGRLRRRTAGGRPRLFVDLAFSLPGAGTIVTGTLWGEGIAPGDRVVALPRRCGRAGARGAGPRAARGPRGRGTHGAEPGRRRAGTGRAWPVHRPRGRRLGRLRPARRLARAPRRRSAPVAHAQPPAGLPRDRRGGGDLRVAGGGRARAGRAATPNCASRARCPRRPATGSCCTRRIGARSAARP